MCASSIDPKYRVHTNLQYKHVAGGWTRSSWWYNNTLKHPIRWRFQSYYNLFSTIHFIYIQYSTEAQPKVLVIWDRSPSLFLDDIAEAAKYRRDDEQGGGSWWRWGWRWMVGCCLMGVMVGIGVRGGGGSGDWGYHCPYNIFPLTVLTWHFSPKIMRRWIDHF